MQRGAPVLSTLVAVLALLTGALCGPRDRNFFMDPKDDLKLWPKPTSLQYSSQTVNIDNPCSFDFYFEGSSSSREAVQIIQHYRPLIFSQSFCEFAKLSNIEEKEKYTSPSQMLSIFMEDPIARYLTQETDESYTLTLNSHELSLKARTYAGFVRGIETFSQLVYYSIEKSQSRDNKNSKSFLEADSQTGFNVQYYIPKTPIIIQDAPKYHYRGIMLDCSRHFISLPHILKTIDALMYNKLNVFHWHLTDDESFPIEMPSYPNLNMKASFSDDKIYRREDVNFVVEYARVRAIRVVPEIDSPGHLRAWGAEESIRDIVIGWDELLYEVPIGFPDPTMDKSYEVAGNFMRDFNHYFPDQFIHLGGDEVRRSAWDWRPEIKNFMAKNNIKDYSELENYYIKRQRDILTSIEPSKKAIYWINEDTQFLRFQDGDILHYWGSVKTLNDFMGRYPNQKYILSCWEFLYLDCGTGNQYGDATWCLDYKTWKKIYSFNVTEITGGSDKVLGAIATMFGETDTDDVIDFKLWPRGISLAEKVWSDIFDDPVPMAKRIIAQNERLLMRGIRSGAITSEYCARHVEDCFPYPHPHPEPPKTSEAKSTTQ